MAIAGWVGSTRSPAVIPGSLVALALRNLWPRGRALMVEGAEFYGRRNTKLTLLAHSRLEWSRTWALAASPSRDRVFGGFGEYLVDEVTRNRYSS